ncbi:hypothetical protein AWC38_SpisGene23105 [Stylophora pistillata]|uniref:Uncharacterized protein n=1 Tax=Stylophora pistillata TaxID=50429 RepID=A0A2B4R905_STYPI|nr:hypothetical protein AWC38_SpisGene23105 [Stylophora pistillata]
MRGIALPVGGCDVDDVDTVIVVGFVLVDTVCLIKPDDTIDEEGNLTVEDCVDWIGDAGGVNDNDDVDFVTDGCGVDWVDAEADINCDSCSDCNDSNATSVGDNDANGDSGGGAVDDGAGGVDVEADTDVGGCDVDDVDTIIVVGFVVVDTVCLIKPDDTIDEEGNLTVEDCVDWIGDAGGVNDNDDVDFVTDGCGVDWVDAEADINCDSCSDCNDSNATSVGDNDANGDSGGGAVDDGAGGVDVEADTDNNLNISTKLKW